MYQNKPNRKYPTPIFISYQTKNIIDMDKYINMNDSFGEKHSVSSTKSFQTSYDQCIQNLKQQLQNHKQALQMAELIIDQYKQENQRLIAQNQSLNDNQVRTEQKYEVLQNLFIKLNKAKQKQLNKQTKKNQQQHILEMENINSKYQKHITSLNEKIFLLQFEFKRSHEKQKMYEQLFSNYQEKNIDSRKIASIQSMTKNRQSKSMRRQQIYRNDCPLTENAITPSPKILNNNHVQNLEEWKKDRKAHGRASLGNKGSSAQSRHSQKKVGQFERKHTKFFPGTRLNTGNDYFSQKNQLIKTAQKRKKAFLYDNNLTDYKALY